MPAKPSDESAPGQQRATSFLHVKEPQFFHVTFPSRPSARCDPVKMNDRITLRFLPSPQDSAAGGTTVAAGRVLEWIDKAGYACAVGWSGSYCVTAYVGNVHFTAPITAGELVEAHARIIHTGRTSMQVLVVIEAADVQSRAYVPATHCILVFVAVDDEGMPREVPRWTPSSDVGRILNERAEQRLAARREIRDAMMEQQYTHEGTTPQTVLRFLAAPSAANWGGNAHGGTVMGWIDDAAYACAAAGPPPPPGPCTRAASTSSGPSASGTSWRSMRGSSTPGPGACTSPCACGRGRPGLRAPSS